MRGRLGIRRSVLHRRAEAVHRQRTRLSLHTRERGGIPKNAVAWYLTAVDFETGKTVYKVFTGCGRNWNNSYGPITIRPNGRAYIGVFNGLVSVGDG